MHARSNAGLTIVAMVLGVAEGARQQKGANAVCKD